MTGSGQMANSSTTNSEAPKIDELIDKLKQIQLGLKQNLLNLHQEIENLDTKTELSINLERFKKDAEFRAVSLEAEVKELRGQLKAIKDILGVDKEKNLVDSP